MNNLPFEGRLYEVFSHFNEFYQMSKKPREVKNLDVEKSEICHNGEIRVSRPEFQAKFYENSSKNMST